MAEPWIRVHSDLGSKPVTLRASDALGVKRSAAVGYLVVFWGQVSRHAANGLVAHYPDALLEVWAGWEGKKGRFAKFIREHHLDADGRVREWDEYAGALELRKQQNREHQAGWRARRKLDVMLTNVLDNPPTIRYDTIRNETVESTKTEAVPNGGSSLSAVRSFLEAVPEPKRRGWEATIANWREGVGYVAGRVAREEDIAQGLAEYLAAVESPTFTPRHVLQFVAKAEQRRVTPEKATDDTGRELTYLEQVARGIITLPDRTA